jgi:hypothetical protein
MIVQVLTIAQQGPGAVSWWLQSLQLSLPFVTALIGAWLGGAIALGRFKKERGFDRRLEWYERAFRELNSLGWRMAKVTYLYSRDRRAEAEALFIESREELTSFALTLAEGDFYATREGAAAVRQLVDEINRQGALHYAAKTQGLSVDESAARALGSLLDTTAFAIARDARRVLKLEALPARTVARPDIPPPESAR